MGTWNERLVKRVRRLGKLGEETEWKGDTPSLLSRCKEVGGGEGLGEDAWRLIG